MIRFLPVAFLVLLLGCSSEVEQNPSVGIFETCFSRDVFFQQGEYPNQKYAGIVTAYFTQTGQLDAQVPPYLWSPNCSNVRVKIDRQKIEERAKIHGKNKVLEMGERAFCSGHVCGLRNTELNMVFIGDGNFSITETGDLRFEATSIERLEPEDPTPRLFDENEIETWIRIRQGEMRVVNPNYCLIDCDD